MLQESHPLFFSSGRYFGYLFSFFLFTTLLYFVLSFAQKIPGSWTYIHILFITLLIAVCGIILERYLQ